MENPILRCLYPIVAVGVGLLGIKLLIGNPSHSAMGTSHGRTPSIPLIPPKPPTQADAINETQPDLQFQKVVDQYVDRLTQAGFDPKQQGVWVQTGDRMLAQHEGSTRLPAASLTKLATTLLSLDRWKTDHHFITRIAASGPIENGVLKGDLLVMGGGDPLFTWESAIDLGNQLNQLGLKKVEGRLVLGGVFAMNFERDRAVTAELLRQGIDNNIWDWRAVEAHQGLPKGTPKPSLEIQGSVAIDPTMNLPTQGTLLAYQSKPLLKVLKKMNMYSNNDMAQLLVDLLGGPKVMEKRVAELAAVPATEVQFINGSGLGQENQLSPRAVCRVLDVIGKQLQPAGVGLKDVLPIFPIDEGTLKHRRLPPGLIGKTGTLNTVSNLAGAMTISTDPARSIKDPTTLCFALQNQGWDLDFFYGQQEAVLSALKPKVVGSVGTANRVQ
jgi:serine-type D-Ala-D-Ala carboxypeptidase/endopeptidase (penicillin-binding protein 4)